MVAVPYLKRKLDEAHEADAPRALLGAAYTRMPANAGVKERMLHYYRWFLRNVYPSVNAAYYFAVLAFNLAYLFDNTKYHSPLLWLVGTRLRRMTAADYQAIDLLANPPAAAAKGGAPPGPRSFFSPRTLGPAVLSSLSLALPASIFALKFLEWWHASDFARQLSRKAAESLDLPPPVVSGLPEPGKRTKAGASADASPDEEEAITATREPTAETAPVAASTLRPILTVPAPADSALCPICGDEIATATACQTGIVYCYACIHRWVEGVHPRQEAFMADKADRWESGKGRCAVTGRRVLGGTEGLRRIMV
jgi:peroxin-12